MEQKVKLLSSARIVPASMLFLALFSGPTLWLAPFPTCAAGASTPVKEQPRQSAPTPRVNCIVADLEALSELAEDIFELAMSGKMERTAKKMEALKKTAASLPYIQDHSNSILLPRLGNTIAELDQAIAAKNRLDTMRHANTITLIAATVAVPLKPRLPTEVSLLDFNGRELGRWAEMKRIEPLSNIVMRMHLAWQTLMPKLIDQGAISELRRFSEIMGRLESAKTPEEYGRLSRQVTGEMDAMKAVFAKPHK